MIVSRSGHMGKTVQGDVVSGIGSDFGRRIGAAYTSANFDADATGQRSRSAQTNVASQLSSVLRCYSQSIS